MAIPSPDIVRAAKKAAGRRAVDFIKNGMRVGLGTGSTAFFFIEALIDKCRNGLKVEAIATSEHSHKQAKDGGLALLDPSKVVELDVAVDGADEIDPRKRMIKGGGGALLREKIIASMSSEMIVIVDEGKCVPTLGEFPLPLEIAPFGTAATIKALNKKGYWGQLRQKGEAPFLTDNGHYIYDVNLGGGVDNPEYHEAVIRQVPGVLTTGFFFHLAGTVIVGCFNGGVEIVPQKSQTLTLGNEK